MSQDTYYEPPAITKIGSLQELTLLPPPKTESDIDNFSALPSVAHP
jgi:hypothetical protein